MQPDFSKLQPTNTPPVSAAINTGSVSNPVGSGQPNFASLKPVTPSIPANPDGSTNHVGWFHQAVQDIASPFLDAGASAATGLEGLGYGAAKLGEAVGLPGAKQGAEGFSQNIQDISKGVDVPYLGTATPWGQSFTDPTLSGGQQVLKTATQIAGDGLQIASWFTGMGEAKAATEGAGVATDVAKEGITQLAKKTFMQTAIGWVKNALPFSILQGVGTGLGQFNVGKGENSDESQNAMSSAETAVLSTAGNIAGFVAMSGATGLIKAFGTKLLASPTVAAANQYLVDTLSKVMGVEPKLGGVLTGEAVSHVSQALESQITQGHTAIVDAIANTIKTDADPSSLFDIVKSKWTPWIDSLFKARDETWRQQGIQNPQIKGGFSDVTNFINQKIQPLLDSKYTVPMGSGQSYTDASKSALANYVNEVKNVLGEDGTNVVSRTQIQSLMDRASLFSGDGAEQPMINSLRQLLQSNSIKNLSADPLTKTMADLWKKGLDQNSYLQSFLQTKVGGGMKSATQAGDFIDRLFSGKAPGISEAQDIMNGLGGTGSDALKAFSNLIYDRALKYFPYQSSDYMKGGDLLKSFLDKWDSSKLLTPEDSSALRNFSTLMQNKYGDIVDGVKSMIDGKNPDMFHGTKAPIFSYKELNPELYGKEHSLYGPGLYMTNDSKIAEGYARTKGISGNGKILSMSISPSAKMLNLDNPLGNAEKQAFDKLIISHGGEPLPEGITGIEAMDELKAHLQANGDAMDTFQGLHSNLESLGYNGFEHTGGNITGNTPHNVKILFPNPEGGINPARQSATDFLQPSKTDLVNQASNLKADNVQLRQVQSFTKSLGDNPLFTKNTDGSFNMQNTIDALTKANTNGAYDGIIKDLTTLNPEKVEAKTGIKIIRSLAKVGLGLPMVLELLPGFNHFAWGASLLFSGTAGAIGLLARDANKVSSQDVATWVGKLANETDAKGKLYLTPSFYTDFLSGDYAKAFTRLTKLPPDVLKKVPLVVSAIAGKQTYNFADYLGLAQKHMGRDLTPEETQQLQAQFDANNSQ